MTDKLLHQFKPISLSEMNEVQLMKRVDTKFIIRIDQLGEVLNELIQDYRVLEIGGNRLMTYVSQYFDTPDSYFFKMHHNGIAKRIKIRIRNYVESKISFLEVKQKNHQGETVKNRIPVPEISGEMKPEWNEFITNLTGRTFDLRPSLKNSFSRFTLVNKARQERATVDISLAYDDEVFNEKIVIIELKQPKLNRYSPVFKALKKINNRPYSISKYCIGLAHKNKALKQNRFKPKFLKINNLTAS